MKAKPKRVRKSDRAKRISMLKKTMAATKRTSMLDDPLSAQAISTAMLNRSIQKVYGDNIMALREAICAIIGHSCQYPSRDDGVPEHLFCVICQRWV